MAEPSGFLVELPILPLEEAVLLPGERVCLPIETDEQRAALAHAVEIEEQHGWARSPMVGPAATNEEVFGPHALMVAAAPRLSGVVGTVVTVAWLDSPGSSQPQGPSTDAEGVSNGTPATAHTVAVPPTGHGGPARCARITGLVRGRIVEQGGAGMAVVSIRVDPDFPEPEGLLTALRDQVRKLAQLRRDPTWSRRTEHLDVMLRGWLPPPPGGASQPRASLSLITDLNSGDDALGNERRLELLCMEDARSRLERLLAMLGELCGREEEHAAASSGRSAVIEAARARGRQTTGWGDDQPFTTLGGGDEYNVDLGSITSQWGDTVLVRGVTVDLPAVDPGPGFLNLGPLAGSVTGLHVVVLADLVRLPNVVRLGAHASAASLTVVARRIEFGSDRDGRFCVAWLDAGPEDHAGLDTPLLDLRFLEIAGDLDVVSDAQGRPGRVSPTMISVRQEGVGTLRRTLARPWKALSFVRDSRGEPDLLEDPGIPARVAEPPGYAMAGLIDLLQLAISLARVRVGPEDGREDPRQLAEHLLASSLLDFVALAANNAAPDLDQGQWPRLAARCTSLQTILARPDPGFSRVPTATSASYESEARRYLDAATEYSTAWKALRADAAEAAALSQRRKEELQLLVDFGGVQQRWNLTKRGDDEINYEAARAALSNAQQGVAEVLSSDLPAATARLDEALRRYEDDQRRRCAAATLKGVVTVLAQLVAAAATESLTPLTRTLETIGDASNEVAAAQRSLRDTASARASLAEMSAATSAILTTTGTLGPALRTCDELVAQAREGDTLDPAAVRDLAGRLGGVDDLTSSAAWAQYRVSQRHLVDWAIRNGFAEAGEVEAVVERASAQGELAGALLGRCFETGQRVWQLIVENQMLDEQAELCRRAMADTAGSTALGSVPTRLHLFGRLLDAKLSIVDALLHYAQASYYEHLRRPPRCEFSTTQSTADLRQAFAILTSSEPWRPSSQLLRTRLVLDPRVAAALRDDGAAHVRIEPDHEELRDVDHVRVRTVRAWLMGLPPRSAPVTLEIRTSGRYSDRLGAQLFQFLGPATTRRFRYLARPGAPEPEIQIDGCFLEAEVFHPTPFTDWTIAVLSPGPDARSGLTAVELELHLAFEARPSTGLA